MSPRFPNALTAGDFLRDYWQRKPLLMRQALPGIIPPLPADELAGLACEEDVESRIIIEHSPTDWELRHGPFSEQTFARLPADHWTLLVQDVDKYLPAAQRLLLDFRFVPDWRVDDVMISYAEHGGSVGPHTDTYDVFLIQVEGRRRWQINSGDFSEAKLLPDLPVRILADFTPEEEWLLEPGDILYLPPGVAHWGVAEGPCMTCSVGFRAPSEQEMLAAFSHYLVERIPPKLHYLDPPLAVADAPAEIDATAFRQAEMILDQWLDNEALQKKWYGCFVTETKGHLAIAPPPRPFTPDEMNSMLRKGHDLSRHPFARIAFADLSTSNSALFVCGECFELGKQYRDLLALIAGNFVLEAEQLADWRDEAHGLDLLTTLFNLGYLVFDHEEI